MKINQISFYDEFKCTCGGCSLTCCKGWLIPIDNDSYEKYQELKGLDHLKMSLALSKRDDLFILNKGSHTCTFYTRDGLCGLQCRYGEEMLCDTCRSFPRTTYNFKFAGFRSLSLLCPEVVKLLIKHSNDFSIEKIECELPDYELSHNDDKEFFDYLLPLYQKLCEIIEVNSLNLNQACGLLIEAGLEIQNIFINEPISSPDNSYSGAYSKTDAYLRGKIKSTIKVFTPPIKKIDKILDSGYYHIMLKNTSPVLFKMCQSYYSIRKTNPKDEMTEIKISDAFDIESFLVKYLEYSLLTNFYSIFDDYCFKRNFETSVAKTMILQRLLSAYSQKITPINEEILPQLVSAVHRRSIDKEIKL